MIRRFNEDFEKFQDVGVLVLRYFAFDWDDNILHMPTKILMDVRDGDRWVPTEVSTEEFAKVRENTQKYRIRDNDPIEAFKEFRDTGSRKGDAFLMDTIAAYDSGQKAPAWDAFIKCLTEGAIFSIITARGHERDSIKRGVEYIIDNYLAQTPSNNPGYSLADVMMQQLKKFKFYFGELSEEENNKVSGTPSQHPMVQEYLKNCDFFGVSSQGFATQFGAASAQNPEEAKIKAIEYCIDKCLGWAKRLEDRLKVKVIVKFGMSDDDPKNKSSIINYFSKYFSERKGLSQIINLYSFYTGKDTTVKDKTLTSGQKIAFKPESKAQGEEVVENLVLTFKDWNIQETSHQAVGMESSILPHKMGMTQQLYPSTSDAPKDDYHNRLKNQTKAAINLYDGDKKFAYRRKKIKSKK